MKTSSTKMQDLDSNEKNKILQLRREHESETTKLDWMYGNPNKVNNEDYLLGKAVDSGKNHVEHECIPPSIRDLHAATEDDQVDIAKKLQEDPLVEIHRRQIEARKKMLQNPIKLKQMQQMLKRNQDEKSDENDSLSSDDDLNKKLLEKFKKLKKLKVHKSKKKKKRKKSDNELRDQQIDCKLKLKQDSSTSDDHDSGSSENGRKYKKSRRIRSGSKSKKDHSKKKSKNRKYSDNEFDSDFEEDRKLDKKIKTSRENKKSDNFKDKTISSKSRKYRSRSPETSYGKQSRKHTSSKKRKHSDDDELDRTVYRRKMHSYSQEREMLYEKYRNRSNSRERSARKQYSSKHLKDKSDKRNWDSKSRKQNSLTEVEKERRRQEMLDNAQWKEKTRSKPQRKDEEESEILKNYKEDPAFLKKYLLKNTEVSSVEARIKSNINNIQRRKTDMNTNFVRR